MTPPPTPSNPTPNILILGACGTIGKKLKHAWPHALTVDKKSEADLVFDLADLSTAPSPLTPFLNSADVVIHLASTAEPDSPAHIHFESVIHAANLVSACVAAEVPHLILASSDWAAPKAPHLRINTYGHSKRVMETMAEMYSHLEGIEATAIRIGWVPDEQIDFEKVPNWLLENYWNDQKLIERIHTEIEKHPCRSRPAPQP
ncbi:NAD(P)-dependent oxidoreductase [Kiritimatiellota bacterium B12222]|nr:NAD(P)-dependent oxidoreductase [Kiritimatiellota bacterium B12222]